jgi:uncharacterized protein YbaR (Trm112 family)
MQRFWIDRLVCPQTHASFDVDPIRIAEDEVIEAFLVSQDERRVYPLVAGVAVLPPDLPLHMRLQGNVYRRSPINDPRLGRFLLGQAGTGYIVVPFDEVVGHYQDLAATPPEGYDTSRHPEDLALERLLGALDLPSRDDSAGVVIGCGVGRGVFILREALPHALGLDRSVACVRRARNIAVTVEHFFLPAPKGSGMKEIPLDLSTLVRSGVDFAVGHPEALPVAGDSMDVVVLPAGDIQGPWVDAEAAVGEARRVTRPGGWLILHDALEAARGESGTHRQGPYRAVRCP